MSNPNCPFCGAKDIYKCGSWGIDAQETRNLLCREREAHNQTKRERDEAREKIEQQRKEIVRLNGATSHAGGTPLKIALRERDEARAVAYDLASVASHCLGWHENANPETITEAIKRWNAATKK